MKGKRWIPAQDKQLLTLIEQHYSATMAAKMMGIASRSAVIGRASRLGVHFKARRPPDTLKAKKQAEKRLERVLTASLPLVPAALAAASGPRDIILMEDLGPLHCRFPTMSNGTQLSFCGMVRTHGSYCEQHWRLTHQTTKQLARL